MIRLATILTFLSMAQTIHAQESELSLAKGFSISLYSDADLANDIQAMTLDSNGRVVVSGPGYVKTLHDDNGDGKADRATLFTSVGTGAMGLCFDGNDLLYMGDGWLSRYRDKDGDGASDGPPERIAPFVYGEHGGHAIRKGPDGWWYVIGGNDAKIDERHIKLPNSPVKKPQCGAIVRFSPDFAFSEVVAHGFRNPYDFDFDKNGDIYTYDSDCERDELLPWGTPTRIFKVYTGAHHGWRLTGYQRSHAIPDDMPDVVRAFRNIGRGSPTGVLTYRHTLFPKNYQDGVFALDWTFGKVYFLAIGEGSNEAEVFLEPKGTGGFAPVDAVVAPDGALLIAIGGRKSRGAVYRIVPDFKNENPLRSKTSSDLDSVLAMPMPLESHSRAIWEPIAEKLGRGPFERTSRQGTEAQKVRAIEILTEKFAGLSSRQNGDELLSELMNDPSAHVRARLAWSISRTTADLSCEILHKLAIDADPSVRLAALDALSVRDPFGKLELFETSLLENAVHDDMHVRQAVARLLSRTESSVWKGLRARFSRMPIPRRLTWSLAESLRGEPVVLGPIIEALNLENQPGLRLEALRLAALALGGEFFGESPLPSDAGYVSVKEMNEGPERDALLAAVRSGFPRQAERDDFETARLLAMLADSAEETKEKVTSMWSSTSSPTRDVHYLMVLGRLPGARSRETTRRVVEVLEDLDRKLAGRQLRLKQSWMGRLEWIFARLKELDPNLDVALASDPRFPQPTTQGMVGNFGPEARLIGFRKILKYASENPEFLWNATLIQKLTESLPRAEWAETLSKLEENEPSLSDPLIEFGKFGTDPTHRNLYLRGLSSQNSTVVERSVESLMEMPRTELAVEILSVLQAYKRLDLQPKRTDDRKLVLKLLARETGQNFNRPSDSTTYARASDWFDKTYPGVMPQPPLSVKAMRERIGKIDWANADAKSGETAYKKATCVACHAGPRAIGPELNGAASRLSRTDLFETILSPSRDVAPAYQTTLIATKDGLNLEGMVIFESGDGVMLQTSATATVRISGEQIETRRPGDRSLMPEGLLDPLSDQEIANLYAYLRTLEAKPK